MVYPLQLQSEFWRESSFGTGLPGLVHNQSSWREFSEWNLDTEQGEVHHTTSAIDKNVHHITRLAHSSRCGFDGCPVDWFTGVIRIRRFIATFSSVERQKIGDKPSYEYSNECNTRSKS